MLLPRGCLTGLFNPLVSVYVHLTHTQLVLQSLVRGSSVWRIRPLAKHDYHYYDDSPPVL